LIALQKFVCNITQTKISNEFLSLQASKMGLANNFLEISQHFLRIYEPEKRD